MHENFMVSPMRILFKLNRPETDVKFNDDDVLTLTFEMGRLVNLSFTTPFMLWAYTWKDKRLSSKHNSVLIPLVIRSERFTERNYFLPY